MFSNRRNALENRWPIFPKMLGIVRRGSEFQAWTFGLLVLDWSLARIFAKVVSHDRRSEEVAGLLTEIDVNIGL